MNAGVTASHMTARTSSASLIMKAIASSGPSSAPSESSAWRRP
jgi:hypothetical protein